MLNKRSFGTKIRTKDGNRTDPVNSMKQLNIFTLTIKDKKKEEFLKYFYFILMKNFSFENYIILQL